VSSAAARARLDARIDTERLLVGVVGVGRGGSGSNAGVLGFAALAGTLGVASLVGKKFRWIRTFDRFFR
jgi:hypothetical protein